jgi:xyloglucan-specific exo-beta-1,4-glucanase
MKQKITKKIAIVLLSFFSITLSAQVGRFNYKMEALKPGANFYQILEEAKKDFENLDMSLKDNVKAKKQFGRWQTFWSNKVDANGNFNLSTSEDNLRNLPANTSFNKIFNISNENNKSTLSNQSWTQVGPTSNVLPHGYTAYPGMGLVNVIRTFTGSNKAIVGTSNGGIWLTNDISVANPTWSPRTDYLARIGIVDIRIDPSNANNIVALTGDRDSQNRCKSIGVIKSVDGGNTWSTTSAILDPTTVTYISNLTVDPSNFNKMIFIVRTSSGDTCYKTDNAWTSKTTVASTSQYSNDILWTSDFILVSNIFGKIYKYNYTNNDFLEIHDNNEGQSNIVLRFNQSVITNGDVYFLAAKKDAAKVKKINKNDIINATGIIAGVTQVGSTISDYKPQGVYNIAFCVNPNNVSHIWALGVDGTFSKDGGATWTKVLDAYNSTQSGQTYVHPDHHFINYISGNEYWITHDGGVHKIDASNFVTSNTPVQVQDKTSNLVIGQIYHLDLVPTQNGLLDVTLGLQDNDGFSKAPNTQSGNWVAVQAGDGTGTAVNWNNPLIRYMGGTNGQLSRTSTAYSSGSNDQSNVIGSDDDAPFVCEVLVHDTNSNIVLAEHKNFKRSTDNGLTFTDLTSGITISDFDQAGNKTVLVGSEHKIFTNNFVNQTAIINPSNTTARLNSISIKADNDSNLYATVGGYDAANKVFKHLTNGDSNTWQNITYDFPNVSIEKITVKRTNIGSFDEILFVATEVGVFYKAGSASQNWIKLGINLPNVTVKDFKINYFTDKLYAATFGRGLWEISIAPSTLLGVESYNQQDSNIVLFPNPTNQGNDIQVNLPNNFLGEKVEYKIYNYMGGIVEKGILENNKLNTKNLIIGGYIVEFNVNQVIYSHKILIN